MPQSKRQNERMAFHQKAQLIFLGACSLSPEGRVTYLKQACGKDEALRKEVESLLAFDLGEDVNQPSFNKAISLRMRSK